MLIRAIDSPAYKADDGWLLIVSSEKRKPSKLQPRGN